MLLTKLNIIGSIIKGLKISAMSKLSENLLVEGSCKKLHQIIGPHLNYQRGWLVTESCPMLNHIGWWQNENN